MIKEDSSSHDMTNPKPDSNCSSHLNLGLSFETTPTSISDDLKSADNTVDRHVIAI